MISAYLSVRLYVGCSLKCFSSSVGRQKFVREVLNAAPLVCEREEEAKAGRLHFYKPAANNDTTGKQMISSTIHQANTDWQSRHIKKRQRQSESCDRSLQSPPTKRSSTSALTAEDVDLLNSYWGASPCSIPHGSSCTSPVMGSSGFHLGEFFLTWL